MSDKKKKGKGRPSVWTDALIEQLLQLHQEGLSASAIARKLGHGLSRNAVIGKMHRLRAAGKVPARREGQPAAASGNAGNAGKARRADAGGQRRTTGRSATTTRPAAGGQAAVALAAQEAVATSPAPATDNRPKVVIDENTGLVTDIMDLGHRSCRWPIGNPGEEGFSYCGRQAEDGGPYCRHHASIAYTTAQKRAAG